MKKYDLTIIALYVVGLIIGLGFVYYHAHKAYQHVIAVAQITDNQEIERIVIRNSAAKIELYHLKEGTPSDVRWMARGMVTNKDIDHIYIEDRTLYIDEYREVNWCIKCADEVEVVIENSPRVKWLSDEEYAKISVSNKDGQTKMNSYYDF